MLTTEQLADLRAKAEAATPGPWDSFADGTCIWERIKDLPEGHIGECYRANDTAYVVAANPATILKLLDMIEQLQEKNKNLLL